MPLKVEDVIIRVEQVLDWNYLGRPPSFEQRLQDIEAEIARLRGIQQKDRMILQAPDGTILEHEVWNANPSEHDANP